MKAKMFVVLLGGLVFVAGCVSTVNDRRTAAWPFVKDKFEGRYERPRSRWPALMFVGCTLLVAGTVLLLK